MRDVSNQHFNRERFRRMDLIVEHTSNMILMTDANRKIVWINPAYTHTTGWKIEEIRGKNPREFLHGPATDPVAVAALGLRLRQGLPVSDFELLNYKKNGEPFWSSLNIQPILDKDGNIEQYVSVQTDITRRKRAEEEILRLQDSLELRVKERTAELLAANEDLRRFSYSVAHDLRGPLISISGFSHSLEKSLTGILTDVQRHQLGRIRSGASRMAEMIDALLALAQVSRAELHWEPVDIAEISEHFLESLKEVHPHRQVKTMVQHPMMIDGDRHLLALALQNLLENAWKFTGQKDVAEISVGVTKSPSGQHVFFVKDNGVGFDMAHAGKLFGVFERLHTSSEFPGNGIGLANVQQIIKRHGGRVWGESIPGHETTFFFTLEQPSRLRKIQ